MEVSIGKDEFLIRLDIMNNKFVLRNPHGNESMEFEVIKKAIEGLVKEPSDTTDPSRQSMAHTIYNSRFYRELVEIKGLYRTLAKLTGKPPHEFKFYLAVNMVLKKIRKEFPKA